VNFGFIIYSLKTSEVWLLVVLNVPKFPIGTKNHENIFSEYYRKLEA
jgi:hypothetical protein